MSCGLKNQLVLASGKKGPRLLVTGGPLRPGEDVPSVDGTPLSLTEGGRGVPILGSLVDPELSFLPALRAVEAAVRREARQVFSKLRHNGFGLPMQARA